MNQQEQAEYDAWFNSRPAIVQQLILKYPAEKTYKIKPGAPYKISCPGTIVHMYSYRESGEVSVVVPAENKLPETQEHEKELCKQHNRNYADAAKEHVRVVIDPKWLEMID